jgi:hypothetical protein
VSGFEFRISSFRCRISSFGFRIPSCGFPIFEFWVSDLESQVAEFGFLISSVGFRISSFGFRYRGVRAGEELGEVALHFCRRCLCHPHRDTHLLRVPGLRFRVSGFEFRVSRFGFSFLVFRFRFSNFGFRVSGLAVSGLGLRLVRIRVNIFSSQVNPGVGVIFQSHMSCRARHLSRRPVAGSLLASHVPVVQQSRRSNPKPCTAREQKLPRSPVAQCPAPAPQPRRSRASSFPRRSGNSQLPWQCQCQSCFVSVVVTEASSYLRLIDSCITQLKAQGPSRTCDGSKEEETVAVGC